MSDNELDKIRLQKAESMMKTSKLPKEIVKIHTLEEFNNLSIDFPEKVIMIDFWAVWCGPCMTFAPVFEKLNSEYGEEFIFVKVNVDEVGSIAQRYGISGIPTTLFIKGGNVVHKIVGAYPYEHMKKVLEKLKSFNK
ncbi:MAG: thioredoxin [Promethearchaeota archaeon]